MAISLAVIGASAFADVDPVDPVELPDASGWIIVDERPGDGEQCLVCRKRVYGEDVVEISYKGRTFFVGKPFMGDFEADPARYFARLQARSALFDENAMPPDRQMAFGWLWLGVYVLAGLFCAAACGYLAVCKALTPLPWFFAGLFGNVAALALIMFVRRRDAATLPAGIPAGFVKVPTTRAPVPCPACGRTNHPSAGRCADCGAPLTPTVEPETGRAE